MLPMSSVNYLVFLFCLTITSIESKICNRSDTSLVIDSAVAIEEESKVKFLLFYQQVYYESNLMDSDSDERPKFEVKSNITEINSNIIPPIEMSVFNSKQRRIGLVNVSTTPTDNY